MIASFPGPVQIFVACNTKKAVQVVFFIHLWGEPGNKATVMLKIYLSKFLRWSTIKPIQIVGNVYY